MRSRAPMPWSSTPSASLRSCIRSPPSCSSAEVSSPPEATTSSSPRSTGNRSSSARTCRTSASLQKRFRSYQIATVVFVGGSLVPAGGHNILEPALYGKPIIFGSHMQNFGEIAEAFLSNGAAIQVRSGGELEEAMLSLIGDPVRRARVGAAAKALVESNRGARDRTLAVIRDLMPPDREGVVRPFRVVH